MDRYNTPVEEEKLHSDDRHRKYAPNVTMGAMGGPAPPYPRAGMPAQQNPQFQQQMSQQRMRMLAMQQQSSGLVQHLQRSQQYQPPPY